MGQSEPGITPNETPIIRGPPAVYFGGMDCCFLEIDYF